MLYTLIFVVLFVLGIHGWTLKDGVPDGGLRSKHELADEARRPLSNVHFEPAENSIKIQWTPPNDADDVEAYGIEYSLADDHRMTNVPVSASQQSVVLANLEENTLYAIRLYCLYESRAGPLTDWFYVSTRTVSTSRRTPVCPGTLPHASLEPDCLRYPRISLCEYRCHDGYRMSDIANVMFGYRDSEDLLKDDVYCKEGRWLVYNTNSGQGFLDLCLPEADFQKCPLSIPNGSFEPHCGPATDWLCHFECNEGYKKHPYMSGTLKWFWDNEYSLFCDAGTWKTGYEDLGLDVSGVCVSLEHNCTEPVANMEVYTPCGSGYWCSYECNEGYRKHALAETSLYCLNGEWMIRTTKYDPSITPQTACMRADVTSVCPRNIANGHVRDDCNVNCWPSCDEGYRSYRWSALTCENGQWLTKYLPYNDTNVCFPRDGHLCPAEVPNGIMRWDLADYFNQRAYMTPKCNDGYRKHRTMVLECIAGRWSTGQERFGLDTSSACLLETGENTWFEPYEDTENTK